MVTGRNVWFHGQNCSQLNSPSTMGRLALQIHRVLAGDRPPSSDALKVTCGAGCQAASASAMAPGLPERSSAGRQSVQGLPVVRSPSDDPPRGSALDFDAADDSLAPARPRSFGRDSARSGATFALLLVLGALWVYLTLCLMPDPRALARTAGVEPDTVLLKLPRCARQPDTPPSSLLCAAAITAPGMRPCGGLGTPARKAQALDIVTTAWSRSAGAGDMTACLGELPAGGKGYTSSDQLSPAQPHSSQSV